MALKGFEYTEADRNREGFIPPGTVLRAYGNV